MPKDNAKQPFKGDRDSADFRLFAKDDQKIELDKLCDRLIEENIDWILASERKPENRELKLMFPEELPLVRSRDDDGNLVEAVQNAIEEQIRFIQRCVPEYGTKVFTFQEIAREALDWHFIPYSVVDVNAALLGEFHSLAFGWDININRYIPGILINKKSPFKNIALAKETARILIYSPQLEDRTASLLFYMPEESRNERLNFLRWVFYVPFNAVDKIIASSGMFIDGFHFRSIKETSKLSIERARKNRIITGIAELMMNAMEQTQAKDTKSYVNFAAERFYDTYRREILKEGSAQQ